MHACLLDFLHHHSMWYSCELPSLILVAVAVHMICAFGAQEFTVVFFLLLSKAGPELSLEFQVAIQIHVLAFQWLKSCFALCSLVIWQILQETPWSFQPHSLVYVLVFNLLTLNCFVPLEIGKGVLQNCLNPYVFWNQTMTKMDDVW